MNSSATRYQPTTNQDDSPWNFAKILCHTPSHTGTGIAFIKVQLAPVHEFVPGHFEEAHGFTMTIDGVVDVEVAYENRYYKIRAGPGDMGVALSTLPIQLRWNGPASLMN